MRRRFVIGVAAVLVAAALGGEVAYRVAYGTLAWWRDPERITWCGRDYLPTQTLLTHDEVERQRGQLASDDPYPVVTVARVPPLVGRPVLASVTAPATRARLNVPCAMAVFLEVESNAYRTYVISGGP